MYDLVDTFGNEATVVSPEGEIWYGTIIGRSIKGHLLVALHGPRTGEVIFAKREEY